MRVIAARDFGKTPAPTAGAAGPPGRHATLGRAGGLFSGSATRTDRPLRFSDADQVLFFSNTATLLNSGVPLIKALEALATDESLERASRILRELIENIRSGDSFSAALSKHPGVFPTLAVSLVSAGEASGKLVSALERLTEDIERRRATVAQIRQALAYPTIVSVLGTLAIGFLMIFVVPVFEETYAKANMPLPFVTRALIAVSNLATSTWWIVLLLGVGAFLAYWHYRFHPAVQSTRDRLLLRLPLLGPINQSVMVGRFVRTLGSLLAGGLSVKESLRLTERAVKHFQFVEMVRELRLAVTRGEGIGTKLSEYRALVPPLMIRMIALGEQSGDLGRMLVQVGQFAEKDLTRRMQRMTTLIEPIITIVLAAAIGTIAMAIYLPIFDMFQHIDK